MLRPTPVSSSLPAIPHDEVCQFPTTDRDRMLLVYYDAAGEPVFEWKLPATFPLRIGHTLLLRLGRWWTARQRRNAIKLVD